MRKNSITEISHLYLSQLVSKDDIVIDATCGRGNDTLYLSKHCNHVYAFDIQPEAILSTKQLLKEHHVKNVDVIQDSHEHFSKYVKHFKGAIFNLGYLPKGDKTITTHHDITIKTIHQMLSSMASNGFILLVVYPGHPEGLIESDHISSYLSTLDHKHYKIIKTSLPYQNNYPPYILWISKI